MKQTQRLKNFQHWDYGLILVAVIAIFLRTYRPGIWNVNWDELNITFWAQEIGRRGQIMWVSNNWIGWGIGWNPITRHSAVANYTAAIPYLFTGNPLAVRFFTGLLGGISVVMTYIIVKRYAGRFAAISAGLMFAVSIATNEAARRVINSNLALFAISMWAYTALIGYYDNRRWAKVLHWVFLSLITQYHPTSALLLIPSLVMLLSDWFHRHDGRRQLVTWTAIGIGCAILVTLPWVIGNLFTEQLQPGLMWSPVIDGSTDVKLDVENPSLVFFLQDAFTRFSRSTVSTEYRALERLNPDAARLYPASWTDTLLYGYSFIGLMGAYSLIALGFRRWWERLPITFFAMVAVFPITLAYLLSPKNLTDPYFYSIAYGFFPIMGIFAARLARWNQIGRWFSIIVIGVYVFLQLMLTVGTYRWIENYGWYQPLMAPMETYRGLIDEWSNETGDVVIVVDTNDKKFSEWDAQRYFWSIMSEGKPVRIINRFNGQGIPVASNGTRIVSLKGGATVPRVADEVTHVGEAWEYGNQPVFQTAMLFADDVPPLDFAASDVSHFSNGVQLIGAYFESNPQPDTIVPLTLIWQPNLTIPEHEYQFSVRLVDTDGNAYGQRDFRSLDRIHWRDGDVVLSPTEIAVNENFSPDVELLLQIIMYRFDNTQALDAVDENGNIIAPWLFLKATTN